MLRSGGDDVLPLTEETLFDVFWQSCLVHVQMVPLWLLCDDGMLQLYYNLSKEIIVGSKPIKVPNSHFQVSVV